MRTKQVIFLLALSAMGSALFAQDSVTGVVRTHAADKSVAPLPDARVGWAGGAAVMSGPDGHFALPMPTAWPATLVTSSFSTTPDSLRLDGPPNKPLTITVEGSVQLAAAEVSERQASTRVSLRRCRPSNPSVRVN